jgi:hypothetical protein
MKVVGRQLREVDKSTEMRETEGREIVYMMTIKMEDRH